MKKIILLTTVIFCCLQFCYSQAGNLDSSFGTNGLVTADLGEHFLYGQYDPATQVLLQPDGSMYFFHGAITRRRRDGSIDSSFGINGSSADGFFAIKGALQTDGKIVALGNNAMVRYNSNGTRDKTFSLGKEISTDGFSITGLNDFTISCLAIQNDGKIVAAGSVNNSSTATYFDFTVVRLKKNGNLDHTFSKDGRLDTDFGSAYDGAVSIGIQSDGKIVVAGNSNNNFALARYNSNGSLDNTFSGDGKQTTDFNLNQDNVTAMAIQEDGKIILGGFSQIGPYYSVSHFALARYNSDGALDKTFSGDGKQTGNFGADNVIYSLAVQNDKKIVVGGYYRNIDENFFIVRYKENGNLDKSFSEDARQTTVFGSTSYNNHVNSVVIQPDGKIIAAGFALPYFAAARYNKDGGLDNTFDEDGKLTDGYKAPNTDFKSTAIQKDGKIVVTGTAWNGKDYDFAIARYNTDGSFDKNFNQGSQLTDVNFKDDYAYSVAIQNDGKIVAAGYSFNDDSSNIYAGLYNSNISIVRYNVDGTLDKTFSGDGKQIMDFPSNPRHPNSVAIQKDGKIVVAGNVIISNGRSGTGLAFVIIRYNTDGSLDKTFSEDGKEITQFTEDRNPISAYASSVAINSVGKIIAGGYVYTEYGSCGLVQYNQDGSLDWLRYAVGDAAHSCSIAIQKDDKIVLAGRSYYRGYSFIEMYRFNPDGSGDPGFTYTEYGGDGNGDDVTAVALQSDGKIVLVGSGIFRYKANGTFDSTFGDNGIKRSVYGLVENIIIANNKLYGAGRTFFSGGSVGLLERFLLDDKPQNVPIVNIARPAKDTTYISLARIKLNAVASDADGSITKVEFYNGNTLLHTETEAPYDCILDSAGVGNYVITAKAYDNDGNVATSAAVNIFVIPNKLPTVAIKTPANGASFPAPANVILTADANDADGRITKLEFYNGNTLLFTETAAPYERKWFHLRIGDYSVTAKAYDNTGGVTTSFPVTFSVVPYIDPVISITSLVTDNNGKTTTSAPVNISGGAVPAPMARNGKSNILTKPLSLNVSPNPVIKTLTISVEGLQTNKRSAISLLSVSGVVIKTIQSTTLNKNMQLNVSSLSGGIYYIKIINGDKILYKRFVKL